MTYPLIIYIKNNFFLYLEKMSRYTPRTVRKKPCLQGSAAALHIALHYEAIHCSPSLTHTVTLIIIITHTRTRAARIHKHTNKQTHTNIHSNTHKHTSTHGHTGDNFSSHRA